MVDTAVAAAIAVDAGTDGGVCPTDLAGGFFAVAGGLLTRAATVRATGFSTFPSDFFGGVGAIRTSWYTILAITTCSVFVLCANTTERPVLDTTLLSTSLRSFLWNS